MASWPGQKGQTSRAATDSLAAWLNESGRRARSVATATHRPVIKSCRNWGNSLAPEERTPRTRESFHYRCHAGTRLGDPLSRLKDRPYPPERSWIRERIAVHQDEVGRVPRLQPTRVRNVEQLATAPGDGGERLLRLEASLDQLLHLPCQVSRPYRTTAEVGAGRDLNPRAVGRLDRREGALAPCCQTTSP